MLLSVTNQYVVAMAWHLAEPKTAVQVMDEWSQIIYQNKSQKKYMKLTHCEFFLSQALGIATVIWSIITPCKK